MSRERRTFTLAMLMLAGLAGAAAWASSRFSESRENAQAAAEDLNACRHLASALETLRRRPNFAGAEEMQLAVLAQQIEAAGRNASLPSGSITRIWPEPARRVGETVYKEKPTQIAVKNVSMRQLVTFLYNLSAGSNGLSVNSLRLTAPRGQDNQDVWSVEATVNYLIYSPPGTEAGG